MKLLDKASKALDKYNGSDDHLYDFEDVRSNIKVTLEHIRIELNEHQQREQQTPWMLTMFGFLVAYAPKLFQFIASPSSSKIDVAIFTLYIVLLVGTVVCLIEFMIPRKRLQLNPPRVFYRDGVTQLKHGMLLKRRSERTRGEKVHQDKN